MESIPSLPEFVEGPIVVLGDVVDELAEVALEFLAALHELNVGVDVPLAPLAPDWALLLVVNHGDVHFF